MGWHCRRLHRAPARGAGTAPEADYPNTTERTCSHLLLETENRSARKAGVALKKFKGPRLALNLPASTLCGSAVRFSGGYVYAEVSSAAVCGHGRGSSANG